MKHDKTRFLHPPEIIKCGRVEALNVLEHKAFPPTFMLWRDWLCLNNPSLPLTAFHTFQCPLKWILGGVLEVVKWLN